MMTVETEHAGEWFPGTKDDIREYLEEKGYVLAYSFSESKFYTF